MNISEGYSYSRFRIHLSVRASNRDAQARRDPEIEARQDVVRVVRQQAMRERERLQRAARSQQRRHAAEALEREKQDALADFSPEHPLHESVWAMREMQANVQDTMHALRMLSCRVCKERWYTAERCAETIVYT